jgi:putative acetyltransferase
MTIRPEQTKDIAAIKKINLAAFKTEEEAWLVDEIRKQDQDMISLVAEKNNQIVGHIMFSQGSNKSCPDIKIIGLAPMAVLPEHQNKGIGSRLVKAGIQACKEAGYQAIIVLGHPNFYPKFGFIPSINFNLKGEYDVPPEVFMVLEIEKDILSPCSGILEYHPIFKMS